MKYEPSYIKNHSDCNVADCNDRLTEKCLDCANNKLNSSNYTPIVSIEELDKRLKKLEKK